MRYVWSAPQAPRQSCAPSPPELRRQGLEQAAPHGRAHRGNAEWSRHPATSSHRSRARQSNLYETVYCGRGQAENFIKWHKAQLASDRTSCRDPKANQFRLILHTAAYWLMLTARNAIAKRSPLAVAEFATLRLRLIKIAARVIEGAARIRVFLPTACPDRAVFRQLAGWLCAVGP